MTVTSTTNPPSPVRITATAFIRSGPCRNNNIIAMAYRGDVLPGRVVSGPDAAVTRWAPVLWQGAPAWVSAAFVEGRTV